MYQVVFSSECKLQMKTLKKQGLLQLKDLDYIFSWVNEMERFGPIFIESQTSWNDHPLVNKRAGQHSSSFSESGRIIYRIHKNRIIVLKITTTHDYS